MSLYEIMRRYDVKECDVFVNDNEIVVKIDNKIVAIFSDKVGKIYTTIRIAQR